MARNDKYFYISGFIALSLFTLFFTLFIMMMFNVDKQKNFALKKDNFISISLKTPTLKKTKAKKIIKKEPPKEVTKEKTQEISQNLDVNDLFSDVWTKKITRQKPKKNDFRRIAQIQKKIKIKKENTTAKENIIPKSSANEVNEYLAKIQTIIYNHFTPPPNSEGNTVKILIVLSAIGKVEDFRILTYSSNAALNEECDKIKNRLRGVLFPINPDNKSTQRVVNITSDKNN